MIYVFQNVYQIDHQSVCTEVNVTAVCNQDGQWESSSVDIKFCEEITGIFHLSASALYTKFSF